MNPEEFNYIPSEVDFGGNVGDVLQIFVNDFTLRQSAGEAKVRDVERQMGGITSELFIIQKLLHDFQVRVNDDHDIIMRLQHEIEALQNRVKSLDNRHTEVESQSGRLDLRIEQLREHLDRNCQESHQNVNRLLGSFARASLVRNNNVRQNSDNHREARYPTDHINSNDLSDKLSKSSNESSYEAESSSNDNDGSLVEGKNEMSSHHQQQKPHTFQNTPTTTVSTSDLLNEKQYEEDKMRFSISDDGDTKMENIQSIFHCDKTNNLGEGNLLETQTEEAKEPLSENTGISEVFTETCDESCRNPFPDVNCNSNIPIVNDDLDFMELNTQNAVVEEDTLDGIIDDNIQPIQADTPVPNAVSASHNDGMSDIDLQSEGNEQAVQICPIIPENSDQSSENCRQNIIESVTALQTPTTSTTKKSKSKKPRGRKRKDSRSTSESEQTQSTENFTLPNQDSITQVTSASASSLQISDNDSKILSQVNTNSSEELLVTKSTVNEILCTADENSSLQEGKNQMILEDDTKKALQATTCSQLQCDENNGTHFGQKTFDRELVEECNQESSSICVAQESLEQHEVPNSENDCKVKEYKSFNISVEQEQRDSHPTESVKPKKRKENYENMSPQSRRRVTFQQEIEDDDMPDLSDIDGLTEDDRNACSIHDDMKQNIHRNAEEKRIEIKSPTGETTSIEPVRPRKEYKRMESETSEAQKEEEVIGICANCSNLAKLRCGNCRQAFYCKRECQKDHWKSTHKDQCRPYQVLESPELGRYIVASRDLKAGDVILKEDPIVVGPKQITEPICLSCYKRVDGSYRCQKCHWPLCGPQCEKSLDHQPECIVGAEIGSPIDISNFDEPNHFYEVVFPLRCLALKKKSPKKYEQLMSLDSHYDDRKGAHVYVENQKTIVNVLRNYFFLQQFPIEDIDSSEKSIHTVTGIIDVNALEIRLPESEILGLYPNFAMMEHSCTPNTKHDFTSNRQVILKAAVDIKRGEHLSTMYTHILWGTLARRDHLKHAKYFMCTCFRCSDPTELGTNFSTIRCQQCENGFMLSAAPLDELADWICTSCSSTIKNEEVTEVNLKLGEEIEKVLVSPSVPTLEELLQKHAKTTVHPNHYHLFATRHTLLQMYGRDPQFANEDCMKKKERMCQDFLKVCTALDPGMSRLAPYAGVALYEYHLAVLSRTRQDPQARQTDPGALKKDVETAKALLQQCIRVLQDEPKDQPEGQLCHVAQQNLTELRQWEATLFSP